MNKPTIESLQQVIAIMDLQIDELKLQLERGANQYAECVGKNHNLEAEIASLKSQPIDVEGIKKRYYEAFVAGDLQNETDIVDADKAWEWFLPYLSKGTKQE